MSELFTKRDLVVHCAEALSPMPKSHVEYFLELIMETMSAALMQGRRVRLGNIGTVERIATPARKARNPRTREVIDVQAGYRIKFRASRAMRGEA